MNRLLKQLHGLARSWWRIDSIRISPAEGRLLRLQPPCYLRLGAEVLEITRRRTVGQSLIYDCADGDELQVSFIDLTQAPQVHWRRQEQTIELSVSELEVFSPDNQLPASAE